MRLINDESASSAPACFTAAESPAGACFTAAESPAVEHLE